MVGGDGGLQRTMETAISVQGQECMNGKDKGNNHMILYHLGAARGPFLSW